jgi:hypothetical protein
MLVPFHIQGLRSLARSAKRRRNSEGRHCEEQCTAEARERAEEARNEADGALDKTALTNPNSIEKQRKCQGKAY